MIDNWFSKGIYLCVLDLLLQLLLFLQDVQQTSLRF